MDKLDKELFSPEAKRASGFSFSDEPKREPDVNRPISDSRRSSELKKLLIGHFNNQSAKELDVIYSDKLDDQEVDNQVRLDGGDSYLNLGSNILRTKVP